MQIIYAISFLIIGLSLFSCNDPSAQVFAKKDNTVYQPDTIILLFQKEQKGEIWVRGEATKRLDSFAWAGGGYSPGLLSSFADLPIAIGTADRFQGKRAYVFPFAPGPGGLLENCFSCRHDKIQLYAGLDLVLSRLGK